MRSTTHSPDSSRYYGMGAWELWEREHPPNLKSKKLSPTDLSIEPAFDVHTFKELKSKVAFLNVMNKSAHLLYRGQYRDFTLEPTILRDRWTVPGCGYPIAIAEHREWYWTQLSRVCDEVADLLKGRLPRWRPFHRYKTEPWLRVAPWSVVQHYELWPTPLLDFTSSLRVAASFALGPEGETSRRNPRSDGYVYVGAFEKITGDVINDLGPASNRAVVRLSAVCPPSAERPHLQEGFLVGNPNFGASDLMEKRPFAAGHALIARFHLVNQSMDGRSASFWDDDFRVHTEESLLPTHDDELGSLFDSAFHYDIAGRTHFSLKT